jgi:hypothetical protein
MKKIILGLAVPTLWPPLKPYQDAAAQNASLRI